MTHMQTKPILWDGPRDLLSGLLGDEYELVPWEVGPSADAIERVVGIVSYSHPAVDGPLMDRMPGLKVVSNHGVGVDHIDVAAARERGIPVGNTPGCLDNATADMTLALMLSVARNIRTGDIYARSPQFLHYDPSILIGQEVSGSTLGIIGMGRIGKQVAKRARGFDMQILYHNRNRDEQTEEELGVSYSPLDELLQTCDFVTLNCPLTAETTGLISTREFELMKPTAILLNIARGPVVDTDALCQALSSGQIAAAGLDVTDPEPLPRDHPLLKLENAIILPHLGSASNVTRRRMLAMSIKNLEAGIEGRNIPYPV